jgi:hypothetical protein
MYVFTEQDPRLDGVREQDNRCVIAVSVNVRETSKILEELIT